MNKNESTPFILNYKTFFIFYIRYITFTRYLDIGRKQKLISCLNHRINESIYSRLHKKVQTVSKPFRREAPKYKSIMYTSPQSSTAFASLHNEKCSPFLVAVLYHCQCKQTKYAFTDSLPLYLSSEVSNLLVV